MKKRILSALLAIVMLISALPFSAIAYGTESYGENENTVKYAPSGIGFHLLNVFLLAEIREFAEEAIVAAAGLRGGFAFFKKRTSVKLGYNEISIIHISLFCQFSSPLSHTLILLTL